VTFYKEDKNERITCNAEKPNRRFYLKLYLMYLSNFSELDSKNWRSFKYVESSFVLNMVDSPVYRLESTWILWQMVRYWFIPQRNYIFIDKVCKLLKHMATQGQCFLITLERLLPVKPKMQVKGCRKMKVIVTMMKLSK
jgi:hypothetical protein